MFIDNNSVKDAVIKGLTLVKPLDVINLKSKLVSSSTAISIGFVNQHAYNLINKFPEVNDLFHSLTYRFRDGVGLKIACDINGCDSGYNLNGTDFIPDLIFHYLQVNPDADVFVFGTQEPWLTLGCDKLFNNLNVEKLDGFKNTDEYLSLFTKKYSSDKKTLVLLAMGMPKQELIAKKIIKVSLGPVLVICGGAIVDFSSKRFNRAPKLFRQFGLEWLYRLIVEPKRLFSRYIIGIPMFFFYILKNRFFSLKEET
ncbi:WecB/TagA/CpsF family glycosyltransferase [Shewanella frigidimarina]|uniref:WecB/TagA/CpsF family glycosyltransferase n=1 Tax=Shewanella TaxID=22 RepID=UPI0016023162|nr:WecB/TagA/CpsF family glycosyltransferase [Shewanella sp. SG41-3]MBB1477097.1 WecB/TagA/CpsF family glycosyltransferase [Shewanella sp. SG41-3]|tara:strand:- start:658 stop:1422 length:765 start_codon:yes stop_codon:yes gene_type:complete